MQSRTVTLYNGQKVRFWTGNIAADATQESTYKDLKLPTLTLNKVPKNKALSAASVQGIIQRNRSVLFHKPSIT